MPKRIVGVLLLPLAAAAAYAQSAPASFEVASVKQVTVGAGLAGEQVNAGSFRCNCSFSSLLVIAYDMVGARIEAPAWTQDYMNVYQIDAKLPANATPDQIPAMLQRLLAERFQLVVHRESRTTPVYTLTIDRGGLKLKPAQPDPDAKPIRFTNLSDGQLYFAGKMTLAEFAEFLNKSPFDRQVVDLTGNDGSYDILLNARIPEDALRPPPHFRLGAGIAESATDPGPPPDPLPYIRLRGGKQIPADPTSVFTAIRNLGMRLERTRAPIEFLVVDHLNRVPSGN